MALMLASIGSLIGGGNGRTPRKPPCTGWRTQLYHRTYKLTRLPSPRIEPSTSEVRGRHVTTRPPVKDSKYPNRIVLVFAIPEIFEVKVASKLQPPSHPNFVSCHTAIPVWKTSGSGPAMSQMSPVISKLRSTAAISLIAMCLIYH